MDLLTGLTAANQAIGIVKDLREIDQSVDEASYKLKLAELSSALADAKLALADAKVEMATLAAKIDTFRDCEICPKCRVGRLNIDNVEPAITSCFEFHNCSCRNNDCDYQTTKYFDSSLGRYLSQRSK